MYLLYLSIPLCGVPVRHARDSCLYALANGGVHVHLISFCGRSSATERENIASGRPPRTRRIKPAAGPHRTIVLACRLPVTSADWYSGTSCLTVERLLLRAVSDSSSASGPAQGPARGATLALASGRPPGKRRRPVTTRSKLRTSNQQPRGLAACWNRSSDPTILLHSGSGYK